MKVWLGVIGRACVEFTIILILVSFAVGAAMSVSLPLGGIRAIYKSSALAALGIAPLAATLTLFLAFFSFEFRVKSRLMGWVGLFLLGAILFSFSMGLRRVPLIQESIAIPTGGVTEAPRPVPTGVSVRQGRLGLWIGSLEGGEVRDAVAVDFGSDYPRLSYSPRAGVDSSGTADIQGRAYPVLLPKVLPLSLVPEAEYFAGSWIWDRLAKMDRDPVLMVTASVGGFLLLALGFRFLCRITRWPLANALLAAVGLTALMVADATLSGDALLGTIESLTGRLGFPLHGLLLIAAIEGLIGLVMTAIDLAAAPKARRRLGE